MARRSRKGWIDDLLRSRLRFGGPPKKPPRRKPPPKGGSEPVTVEPNRPKQGEGGATAALEFDGPWIFP